MAMKLTIGVVTMNRKRKLRNALMSCLSCKLPKETEFVVIDNASTDNTYQVVDDVLGKSGYNYVYHYSSVNIGAGGVETSISKKAKESISMGWMTMP